MDVGEDLDLRSAWLDQEKNSSKVLCSRLNNEASMVKSLVADRVSLLVQATSTVTIAMVMGLIVAWKLALVMIIVQEALRKKSWMDGFEIDSAQCLTFMSWALDFWPLGSTQKNNEEGGDFWESWF
ncbi:putative ABC transporter B family member 8 [Humulus lupulus]|uniref:putative ABC transporter B family member 8 n=1 Tax=Humulus lupulus TaxID=3486 RepID=UPI002B407D73|nr:putative ABC transporter B family member 8 [Humulus lupulus]